MSYSKLKGNTAKFSDMMNHFGVVTVMDAKIYEIPTDYSFAGHDAAGNIDQIEKTGTCLATLDSLKIANVTMEGPSKTVMGGQYSNPLIKFGKTARIEMQDALGRSDAIEAFGGCVNEFVSQGGELSGVHMTEDFAPARTVIGTSFFIDQKTGSQVKVKIIFYQVLPDSIFNLTQDAEGDATVFDLNGDLLTTVITVGDSSSTSIQHGVFYSIIEDNGEKKNKSYVADDIATIAKAVKEDAEVLDVDQTIMVTAKNFKKGVKTEVKITKIEFGAHNDATVTCNPILTADA